jgi:hypothetical protein
VGERLSLGLGAFSFFVTEETREMTTKCKLIESTRVEADYGMLCTLAIVEDEVRGRLFLREGYGGEDSLQGGAIRWRHGLAIRIQPADTLESLRDLDGYLNMVQGFDVERPVLALDGRELERIAEQAGL